ncbi:5-formyltetrahydrofolate cyclo-ligase [Alkalibacterium sp. AK22]|uniref:5-formyltetrahydrofolate cyclo-ligase n=1 Tax=Alkalibacterium sp. AK22 TaxID=1229520 RepID=UPI000447EF63|nr:5-formyltetrahydrofolate cyclo-ligase [Alkalibacterium sp. AK22]EXJ24017.1 5-formyltetrahydrofolate cyclo-ligase [Alkalibacterium sp. AK22]
MSKETLRKSMLLSLEEISWFNRNRIENDLLDHLFESSLWEQAVSIGVTVSSPREWDTRTIIEKAWEEDKYVCVPKSIHDSKALHFYKLTSFKQLEKGYFGLEEPVPDKTVRCQKADMDLLIVPGLIFNRQGFRIGYGGGYFDRFLKDFHGRTVSLLHSSQLVNTFEAEEHDVPVDYLITEEGLLQTDSPF